jgi:hypothetical protein
MPGLCLTCQQAQRLWGLDEATCAQLLNTLVDLKFLQHGFDGRYTRWTDDRLPTTAAKMAVADIAHDETQIRRHPTSQRAV